MHILMYLLHVLSTNIKYINKHFGEDTMNSENEKNMTYLKSLI